MTYNDNEVVDEFALQEGKKSLLSYVCYPTMAVGIWQDCRGRS